MEELIKKFNILIASGITGDIFQEAEILDADTKCAEECKKIAIEFATSLMDMEITTHRAGNTEGKSEVPSHYRLMQGMLVANGEKMFNDFLKQYYERTNKEI